MKKKNLKKIFSAFAVLAVSVTAVAGVFAGCSPSDADNDKDGDITAPEVQPGKVYYVSPTAATSASATGSIDDPYNISVLLASASILKQGDTVYVLPGTYKVNSTITMTVNGAYNNNIKIINAALDSESGYTGTEKRAVLDFSAQAFASTARGVQIYGDYVYWYGVDICGAGDNGMYIGGSYNTVEYCEFYNNRDTGLQIGRAFAEYTSIDQWPSYNLIKNCTSHNNYDNETYGENADGFAAKLTIGYGNVFDGCVAYRNSDDGWDLYAKTDSGNIGAVIIYNCVAFENGYLEYTQQEYNKLFPTWNPSYSESADNQYGANSYKTRDGDGNGFKLGGSVMEGDVVMYNCLSYGNRMHGVTDNSNPGVLNLTGITSYNNSAAIDNNPESDYFGQVMDIANDDTHGNIDVSRQTYSYNNLEKILSVKDGLAKSLAADAYRGAVTDSILGNGTGANKANVIEGSVDADTKNGGVTYTSQVDDLVASDIFGKLPVVKTVTTNEAEESVTSYTYNLSGLEDLGTYDADGNLTLSNNRVHVKYRNADGSLNLGDILAVKDYTKLLGNDNKIGAVLNLADNDAYTHFVDEELLANSANRVASVLNKAKETLTIATDLNACYQNFDVLSKMIECHISWSSSDPDTLSFNQEYDVSVSKSEYITVQVVRPTDADKKVTLTATISYLNQSVEKQFEITVKKDNPSIGNITVNVAETGEVINDGGRLIIDMYRQYNEPKIAVENGAYYNGTLLKESQFNVKSTYKYSQNDSTEDRNFVEVNGYNPNVAGVYKITHTVSLANDPTVTKSFTYKVFVASTTAEVDFIGDASFTVNREGYIISGALNSVTGSLYAVSSDTKLTLDGNSIKTAQGVKSYDFRDTSVSFQFENNNNGAYYVYYALANAKGDVTSEVYETEVKVVEISTTADFMKLAGGEAIGEENPAETIYALTADLDFTGVTYTVGAAAFKGLLNGQGHTVSGITVTSTANSKAAVFYQVTGGTIENIKFDNIRLTGAQRVGIVAEVRGGYFYNIAMTDVYVSGAQRVGGLIGQIYEGAVPAYVEQVSIVNEIPALTASGEFDESVDEASVYYIKTSATRAGAIIGFIQPSNSGLVNDVLVYVTNCYSSTYVYCGSYSVSGMVGEYDDTYAASVDHEFRLEITNCLSKSVLISAGSSSRNGGMLGYQQGSGVLRITNCLSNGRQFYSGEEVLTCQKNCSGIMGNYNTSADAVVKNCYAIMEEHNTDFDVQAYVRSYYSTLPAYSDDLKWDLETVWTFTAGEGVTLNFLGNWDSEAE